MSNHKCWATQEVTFEVVHVEYTFWNSRISPHPSFATLMACGEQSWSYAFPRVSPRIRTTSFVSFQQYIHLIIFHFWIVSHSFLEYSILVLPIIFEEIFDSWQYLQLSCLWQILSVYYSGKELRFGKIGFENSSYIS